MYLHLLVKKYFYVSVACIKEKLANAADVKIEPDVNSFLIKVDGFSGTLMAKKQNQTIDSTDPMQEITIKEEPLQNKLVR